MFYIIKSPFNYTGGKYKLLPQITPLFPKEINTFVDLFGGGFNVGANINCNKIIYNDSILNLTKFFSEIYLVKDLDNLKEEIYDLLSYYNNIQTKEDYLELRKSYNEDFDYKKLFILGNSAFNYAIRFNSKGLFNVPSGLPNCRITDDKINNFIDYIKLIQNKKIEFISKDFNDFNITQLKENDFVYLDPPYYLSIAPYNNCWSLEKEKELLLFLDKLNERNIKFALSNVIFHKNKEHSLLIDWSKKYNIHYLNYDYKYTWSHKKLNENKKSKTIEVLITNY